MVPEPLAAGVGLAATLAVAYAVTAFLARHGPARNFPRAVRASDDGTGGD